MAQYTCNWITDKNTASILTGGADADLVYLDNWNLAGDGLTAKDLLDQKTGAIDA